MELAAAGIKTSAVYVGNGFGVAASSMYAIPSAATSVIGTGIKKSASAIYAGSEYGVAAAGAAATSLSSFDLNAGESVKKTLTSVGYGVGIATLSTLAIPYVVTALGFGAGGVVASSTAASMMSTLGTSSWSIVPVCQSIGATGVISKVTALGIGATATAVHSKL